eukprot:UN16846
MDGLGRGDKINLHKSFHLEARKPRFPMIQMILSKYRVPNLHD